MCLISHLDIDGPRLLCTLLACIMARKAPKTPRQLNVKPLLRFMAAERHEDEIHLPPTNTAGNSKAEKLGKVGLTKYRLEGRRMGTKLHSLEVIGETTLVALTGDQKGDDVAAHASPSIILCGP